MLSSREKKLLELSRPQGLKSFGRFLRMSHMFKGFLEDFSQIALPLTDLTKNTPQVL
jgi:hypothetical protein